MFKNKQNENKNLYLRWSNVHIPCLCPSGFLVPLSSLLDASKFCSLSTFQVLSLSVSTSKPIRIFWHHLHHTKPLLTHIGRGFGIWGQYKCFLLQHSDNKGSIFSVWHWCSHAPLWRSIYPQSNAVYIRLRQLNRLTYIMYRKMLTDRQPLIF